VQEREEVGKRGRSILPQRDLAQHDLSALSPVQCRLPAASHTGSQEGIPQSGVGT
jgi:hypothetical protein